MCRIVVLANLPVLTIDELEMGDQERMEKAENLGLPEEPEYKYTKKAIALQDIYDYFEYKPSPGRTVITFFQDIPILVKESFDSFHERYMQAINEFKPVATFEILPNPRSIGEKEGFEEME